MRHAAPARHAGTRPMRFAVAALFLWSVFASVMAPAPRYERVGGAVVAVAVLALSALPRSRWNIVRTAASATAVLLLALAGVVAGSDMEESFALLAYAVLLGLVAALAGRFAVIPGSKALEKEMRELRRTVERLVEASGAPPACGCPPSRP